MAALLGGFLDGARRSLEIAIYDMAPGEAAAGVLAGAVAGARARGVRVRLVFNREPPARGSRRPLPPPGFVDWDFLRRLAIDARAIEGVPDLMHHKYAVRDAGGPAAAVWTGSTNWTPDSWTREENVIVRARDAAIADAYAANFEELWESRSVQRSGHQPVEWSEPAAGVRVCAYFTPGRAQPLVHRIAERIGSVQGRLRVCSPVITSGPILGILGEVLRRPDLDAAGCYDRTQMDQVERQWTSRPVTSWKVAAWHAVREAIPWGAKRSTPWQPGAVHDFMHAKCTVVDDAVFVGSYNLSHSGEANAENVLEIESRALADAFAAYIEALAARYRRAPWEPRPRGDELDPGASDGVAV